MTSPDAPRRTVLYRGGHIHTPTSPTATATLTQDATIAWIGSDDTATTLDADTVIDLDGALITPAFVDAHIHIHTTATGLALTGLDLTAALNALAAHARRHRHTTLFGTGWDETTWADPTPPTAGELDRATGGTAVYLARVDGHTAVISTALATAADAATHPGWHPDGLVTGPAHHTARHTADTTLTPSQRRHAWQTTRTHAAALGIAALHEMAGPDISSADDLAGLLTHARTVTGPDIVGYWAGDLPPPSNSAPPGAATPSSTAPWAPTPPPCTPPTPTAPTPTAPCTSTPTPSATPSSTPPTPACKPASTPSATPPSPPCSPASKPPPPPSAPPASPPAATASNTPR